MVASQQSGLPETIGVSLTCPPFTSLLLTVRRLEQWVSVKIAKAERTKQSRELQILRALAQYSNKNPGSEHIVRLLDDFLHEGPNGCHQCLVFELLGPTVNIMVNDAHHFGERLDTDVIIRISTQMLEAVAFIHEAGYAHGGIATCGLVILQSQYFTIA